MEKPKAGSKSRKARARIGAGLVLAATVGAGLIFWLLLDGDSGKGDAGEAEIVSAESLLETAADSATPIFWAGDRQDAELELSRPDEGRTYVRYLTGSAEAGDPRPRFLTVGTYVHPNPVAALRSQARQNAGILGKAPGGATVYFSRNRPQNIYLAYPAAGVEVEVYDPDFTRALRLVNSGRIVRVG